MCNFFSGIAFPNGDVVTDHFTDSHDQLLKIANVHNMKEQRCCRVEFKPANEDVKLSDLDKYSLVLDERITPDWFHDVSDIVESKMRARVKSMLTTKSMKFLHGKHKIVYCDAKIHYAQFARLTLLDNSFANLLDGSFALLYDKSSVILNNNCIAFAYDHSKCRCHDLSCVEVYDNARVELYDHSSCILHNTDSCSCSLDNYSKLIVNKKYISNSTISLNSYDSNIIIYCGYSIQQLPKQIKYKNVQIDISCFNDTNREYMIKITGKDTFALQEIYDRIEDEIK